MSEQEKREGQHTLFIVERHDLDDAVPYQVMKAEHPPHSEQAKALEGVMCQLVEAAEAETGEPHRLVIEADTPAVTKRHYEMHRERIEGETLVTDGGGEVEAAIGQNARCDMPECVGSVDDETHIVKDPSGKSLTMCEACLDDGWRGNVEVLD